MTLSTFCKILFNLDKISTPLTLRASYKKLSAGIVEEAEFLIKRFPREAKRL